MKTYIPWLLLVVGSIAVYLLWPDVQPGKSTTVTDTLYLPGKIRVDTILWPTAPQDVAIHQVDTVTRAKVEKGNIITKVSVDREMLVIEKITPTGLGIRQEYHLPEVSTILIDGTGQAKIEPDKKERRRKFWRKVGLIGGGAAVFILGVMVGK